MIDSVNIENTQDKAEVLRDYILQKFNNKNDLLINLLKKTYPSRLPWPIIITIEKMERSIIRVSNTSPEMDQAIMRLLKVC